MDSKMLLRAGPQFTSHFSFLHTSFPKCPKDLCLNLDGGAVTSGKAQKLNSQQSLANRLRLGSFGEDRLSYTEKFIVRTHEVGINATATMEAIANYLQDVTHNHFARVSDTPGVYIVNPAMKELHLTWVTTRMHIEVYRYPAWSDVIEVESWAQPQRAGARQDWIIRDCATGEVIGRATSNWVTMNKKTRRLQKLPDEVRDEMLSLYPQKDRLAFPEENNTSMKKIDKLEDPAQISKMGIVPRYCDLDMNLHVNSITYIGWIVESVPEEILYSHELEGITLEYRHECKLHDVVDSLASPELGGDQDEKNGRLQFIHLLRFSNDGSEINRARTVWRRKEPKILNFLV